MRGEKLRKINSVSLTGIEKMQTLPVAAYLCDVTFHTTWQRIPDTYTSIQE
jgi:hypothetical protein